MTLVCCAILGDFCLVARLARCDCRQTMLLALLLLDLRLSGQNLASNDFVHVHFPHRDAAAYDDVHALADVALLEHDRAAAQCEVLQART